MIAPYGETIILTAMMGKYPTRYPNGY
jgi:hypothetical protein